MFNLMQALMNYNNQGPAINGIPTIAPGYRPGMPTWGMGQASNPGMASPNQQLVSQTPMAQVPGSMQPGNTGFNPSYSPLQTAGPNQAVISQTPAALVPGTMNIGGGQYSLGNNTNNATQYNPAQMRGAMQQMGPGAFTPGQFNEALMKYRAQQQQAAMAQAAQQQQVQALAMKQRQAYLSGQYDNPIPAGQSGYFPAGGTSGDSGVGY